MKSFARFKKITDAIQCIICILLRQLKGFEYTFSEFYILYYNPRV